MNYKIIIFLLFSLSLKGTVFSYSEMEIPLASIPSLVSSNMSREIAGIKALNSFYENNIIKENQRKKENVEKLIRLNSKEALLMGELISIDKKIKKILEMDQE